MNSTAAGTVLKSEKNNKRECGTKRATKKEMQETKTSVGPSRLTQGQRGFVG